MKITSEELGNEFFKFLNKLIQIRKDKRLIYGDSYLEDTREFLISQIENKLKRVKLHINNNTQVNNIEKAEDNCLDLAIYSLFLCSNLEDKKWNIF